MFYYNSAIYYNRYSDKGLFLYNDNSEKTDGQRVKIAVG